VAKFKPCQVCGLDVCVTKRSRPEPTCRDCRRTLTREEKIALGINKPQKQYPDKNYDYKKTPCAHCGALVWKSQRPTIDGLTMCRPCRGAFGSVSRTRATVERACAWCLDIFELSYLNSPVQHCSMSCAQRRHSAHRARSRATNGKARRADRERVAPGLRPTQRKRLLDKWRKAGASCTFCPSPATTVDHMIPLSRGGTNYEGNLAPCCRRCNSSKSDLLISEWLWRKGNSGSVSPSPWLATSLHRVSHPAA
jgi:5-methylcytosine-specific restriction endonuclease McrA